MTRRGSRQARKPAIAVSTGIANRSPSTGSNPFFSWSPGRRPECVAGVDSPLAADLGEHEASTFRVRESHRPRVAVDVEVERGVGGVRQRVRVEVRPALFQYLLAPC